MSLAVREINYALSYSGNRALASDAGRKMLPVVAYPLADILDHPDFSVKVAEFFVQAISILVGKKH